MEGGLLCVGARDVLTGQGGLCCVVTSLFVGEGVQDARSLDDQNSVEMREVYLYNQLLI